MKHPQDKIISLPAAGHWRQALRGLGATLAVTNGCFDILHRGHLELLIAARREADALLVLINSDASVRALKGPERPINTQADRALVIAAMAMVNYVVIFDGDRCDRELADLRPDAYVKSAEYRDRQAPAELAVLQACGARIVFADLMPGYSTTAAIQKMQELNRKDAKAATP